MQDPFFNVEDRDDVCDMNCCCVGPNNAQSKPRECKIDVVGGVKCKRRWDEDWEKKMNSIWLGDIQGHTRD
jgi:hypothetical protein